MIKFPFNNPNKNIFDNNYEDRFLSRLGMPKTTGTPQRAMFEFGCKGKLKSQDIERLKINQLKYSHINRDSEFDNVISTPISLYYFPYGNKISSTLINLLIWNSALLEGSDKARMSMMLKNIYPILLAKYQKIKNKKFLSHDMMASVFLRKLKKEIFSQTHFWGNHQPANLDWLMKGKGNFSFKNCVIKKSRAIYFYILFYAIMLVLLPIWLFRPKINFLLNPNKLDFEHRNLEIVYNTKISMSFFIGLLIRSVVIYIQEILYYLHKDWKDYRRLVTNKYFIKIFNFIFIKLTPGLSKERNEGLGFLMYAGFLTRFQMPFKLKNISIRREEFDGVSTPKFSLRRIYSIMDFEKCNESLTEISILPKKDFIQKLPIHHGALETNHTFINMGTNMSLGVARHIPTPIPMKSKPYFVFFDQHENIPLKFRLLMIEDMAWAVKQINGLLIVKPHPTYPPQNMKDYFKKIMDISEVIFPYKETGRPVKKDFSLAEKSCGVISFYSTATFKAVLENIPSILYNYTSQENYSIVDAYDNGICFDVREKEELAVVMADILAKGPLYRNQMRARKQFFKTYPYYADGYHFKRIKSLAEEVNTASH